MRGAGLRKREGAVDHRSDSGRSNERQDVLLQRMRDSGIKNIEEYQWYLDIRKYGSVPHAGFGLGFERALMYITGMANIRDVLSFPRVPRWAKF